MGLYSGILALYPKALIASGFADTAEGAPKPEAHPPGKPQWVTGPGAGQDPF
jgi:hypothetical protein